ncbi:hypothetical protein [Anaerobacillus arseniciselenatis]|uniref:hypothetical protein n=1 Tax=Anaerobacillus arseniciselenatis TaxID=85682 RepID=UPI001FE01007|nr:hypothetical protein [Anaerobacillus arseniciselenatis]
MKKHLIRCSFLENGIISVLWLVWQDPKNSLYHVGTLSYFNGKYEFNYTDATDE